MNEDSDVIKSKKVLQREDKVMMSQLCTPTSSSLNQNLSIDFNLYDRFSYVHIPTKKASKK